MYIDFIDKSQTNYFIQKTDRFFYLALFFYTFFQDITVQYVTQ